MIPTREAHGRLGVRIGRWERQARLFGRRPEASWRDRFMIDLEIETVGAHLRDGDRVLDAGCGNGFAALAQCARRRIRLEGIDATPGMVRHARAGLRAFRGIGRARFRVGDLRSLPFEDGAFDKVYTTRALINLSTWPDQKRALSECLRVTRPGGKLLVSEAFREPMLRLNALRRPASLKPLAEPGFNLYLRKARFERFLRSKKCRFEADDFSSVYYLGTRFLRELVRPPQTEYLCAFNRMFAEAERKFSAGGFGIQRLYVVRR